MEYERYPDDLIVGVEDFKICGWEEILGKKKREGFYSMFDALIEAAKIARGEGRDKSGKVLFLLADACSMKFDPESNVDPYKPLFVVNGNHSPIPESFSKNDIHFFSLIIPEIKDFWLKSRLADLVWLKNRSLGFNFALDAIDAYRLVPLNAETWIRDGKYCWKRALHLAKMLGSGAGDRFTEIINTLYGTLCLAETKDGFLAFWLAELMEKGFVGSKKCLTIAEKLYALGTEFYALNEFHRARSYFDLSARWFETVKDKSRVADARVLQAETWVKEASARIEGEHSSYIAAGFFYENALQTYRLIPISERKRHGIDQKIAELRVKISEAGERSLDEMVAISSDSFDISNTMASVKEKMQGKPLLEALKIFFNIHPFANVDKLRKDAIKQLSENPLHSAFGTTLLGHGGSVIAKTSGSVISEEDDELDNSAILYQMGSLHGFNVSLVVQAYIWPALEALLVGHRIDTFNFSDCCIGSVVVPRGTEKLYEKIMYFGFDGDFVSAIHILIPQVENFIRWHLYQNGVITSNLDKDGIVTENSINKLLFLEEAKKILGENLLFEFRWLFCDPAGPNLRNKMAHGLVGFDECYSFAAIYAWWLAMRLVFNAYCRQLESAQEDTKDN